MLRKLEFAVHVLLIVEFILWTASPVGQIIIHPLSLSIFRLFTTKLFWPQCISNGVTTVLRLVIDFKQAIKFIFIRKHYFITTIWIHDFHYSSSVGKQCGSALCKLTLPVNIPSMSRGALGCVEVRTSQHLIYAKRTSLHPSAPPVLSRFWGAGRCPPPSTSWT